MRDGKTGAFCACAAIALAATTCAATQKPSKLRRFFHSFHRFPLAFQK
jgi:hypothetical protein